MGYIKTWRTALHMQSNTSIFRACRYWGATGWVGRQSSDEQILCKTLAYKARSGSRHAENIIEGDNYYIQEWILKPLHPNLCIVRSNIVSLRLSGVWGFRLSGYQAPGLWGFGVDDDARDICWRYRSLFACSRPRQTRPYCSRGKLLSGASNTFVRGPGSG